MEADWPPPGTYRRDSEEPDPPRHRDTDVHGVRLYLPQEPFS